jgi:hypothetical protein
MVQINHKRTRFLLVILVEICQKLRVLSDILVSYTNDIKKCENSVTFKKIQRFETQVQQPYLWNSAFYLIFLKGKCRCIDIVLSNTPLVY